MAVAGLLSLMVTWWSARSTGSDMNRVHHRSTSATSCPIGYAAFAFALGVTAGVLIRRTLPAMATTLGTLVAIRLLEFFYVQPHLITPVRHSYRLALGTTISGYGGPFGQRASLFPGTPNIPNAWFLSTDIVDKTGHSLTGSILNTTCPQLATVLGGNGPPTAALQGGHAAPVGAAPAEANQALQSCIAKVGATYHELVTYQPSGHYWPLQWSELALYLGAALLLGGICLWRVRRHLA